MFRKKKSTSGEATDLGPAVAEKDEQSVNELPRELLWLLDAPMFIDEKQVEAFYDAVLRPDYEGASLTLSDAVTNSKKIVGETTVGSAIPWLKAEVKGSAEVGSAHEVGQQATLGVISNAYRHLLALALHYSAEQNDRLILCRGDGEAYVGGEPNNEWFEDSFIQKLPRAMLFIELPNKTKIIPAALELTNGRVLPIFDEIASSFTKPGGETAPRFPGSGSSPEMRDLYWQWFTDNYNDREALRIIEEAVGTGQKIASIDLRVPLGVTSGPFMHLHLAARGQYDTGVFGYNLINRGFKHGLRLVGTLKSEPDLNVLAIFER